MVTLPISLHAKDYEQLSKISEKSTIQYHGYCNIYKTRYDHGICNTLWLEMYLEMIQLSIKQCDVT